MEPQCSLAVLGGVLCKLMADLHSSIHGIYPIHERIISQIKQKWILDLKSNGHKCINKYKNK